LEELNTGIQTIQLASDLLTLPTLRMVIGMLHLLYLLLSTAQACALMNCGICVSMGGATLGNTEK
jgi:hypothetical protein